MTGVKYRRKSNRCRCGGGQTMGLLSAASVNFPDAVCDTSKWSATNRQIHEPENLIPRELISEMQVNQFCALCPVKCGTSLFTRRSARWEGTQDNCLNIPEASKPYWSILPPFRHIRGNCPNLSHIPEMEAVGLSSTRLHGVITQKVTVSIFTSSKTTNFK